jgi:GNAT superfamily N-acetyltransferase
MKDFTLHAATPADARLLTAFRVTLFQDLGQIPPEGTPPDFESACDAAHARYLESGAGMAWIAKAGGKPVGSIVMLLHPRLPSPRLVSATEGYILNVYVDPPWRRRGIATALMRAALERARELGLARLRLHTTEAGRPTYAHAGFRPREDEMELVLLRQGKV